jgi:hypothetical protein
VDSLYRVRRKIRPRRFSSQSHRIRMEDGAVAGPIEKEPLHQRGREETVL